MLHLLWVTAFLAGCRPSVLAPPPLNTTEPPATAGAEPGWVRRSAPTLEASAEIVAVGDIMMHGSVKRAAVQAEQAGEDGVSLNHGGYGALFEGVSAAISSADLAFGNLEFPVAPDNVRGTGSMVFNAPPAVLDALAEAGFDVVSFANNHVYDQGVPGFVETIERLEASPLGYVGAGADCERAKSAQIYELNGIKVGIIAGSRLFNTYKEPGPGRGCVFKVDDEEEILARAAAAREAGAELIIVSVHWGVEYKTAPHPWSVKLAHKLLDGGVDVILGHHPHVLQPVEVYEAADGRRTFVVYSLGNFISGQGYHYRHGLHHPAVGNTRDGGMLRFRVVRKRYSRDDVRVELADLRFDPIWVMRRREVPRTYPVVAREEAARLAAVLAELPEDDPGRRALQDEIGVLLDRRRHAAGVVGAQWLLPEPGVDGEAALTAVGGVGE